MWSYKSNNSVILSTGLTAKMKEKSGIVGWEPSDDECMAFVLNRSDDGNFFTPYPYTDIPTLEAAGIDCFQDAMQLRRNWDGDTDEMPCVGGYEIYHPDGRDRNDFRATAYLLRLADGKQAVLVPITFGHREEHLVRSAYLFEDVGELDKETVKRMLFAVYYDAVKQTAANPRNRVWLKSEQGEWKIFSYDYDADQKEKEYYQ